MDVEVELLAEFFGQARNIYLKTTTMVVLPWILNITRDCSTNKMDTEAEPWAAIWLTGPRNIYQKTTIVGVYYLQ